MASTRRRSVIGYHPHVVQEEKPTKGKQQIAYSLGNLVFGGSNNPSDKNCLIYRHTFTLDLYSRQVAASLIRPFPVWFLPYRGGTTTIL